jgi:aspartokinase-like uncharacterized kinase
LDAVIKVGGSLAETPKVLESLGAELFRLSKKRLFVVVPGGGKFADAVRDMDAKFAVPAIISHKMAILAMDQYGLLLSQIIPDSSVCDSLKAAREISQCGRVPIFLPSRFLFRSDPFEPSWDVTSDSIAAYVAVKLKACKIIFVTDVDGIFSKDPKTHQEAKLISQMPIEKLLKYAERTSLDKFLPTLLSKNTLDAYVVNGFYPARVAAVLFDQKTVCTKILPKTDKTLKTALFTN